MIPPVEYPVELRDIVVVGRLSRTGRTLSVRPLLHGDFELFVWPRRFPEVRWVLRHTLTFANQDDPPAIVVFELRDQPPCLQDVLEWEWSLMRRSAADGVIEASAALFGPHALARLGLAQLTPCTVHVHAQLHHREGPARSHDHGQAWRHHPHRRGRGHQA